MKKYIKIVFVFILLFVIGGLSIVIISPKFYKEYKIGKVLKTEYYEYLPEEAKEYVKAVYMNTGEIVLTEKNKEENTPYLNPTYVTYLTMSSSEKNELDIIPEPYTVEYSYDTVETGSLPSHYDLRNIDGNSYISPLKNQSTTSICWAFASTEQLESLLMIKNSQPYNSGTTKIFSPKQIDYASSTDGILNYENEYGIRKLDSGGNFFMASEVLSYGLSFIDETKMPFTTGTEKKVLNDVLNFSNSNYEVNEVVDLPKANWSLAADSSYSSISDLKTKYLQEIKRGVYEYGGAIVEAVAPDRSCGFQNTDGTNAIEVIPSCYNASDGHAMHIIGWDDDYQYSYCKTSTELKPVTNNTCTNGTKVNGTGAFIIRNSWGSSYSYSYLTYNSISNNDSSPNFAFITDVSSTSERSWDNVYSRKIDYDKVDGISLSTNVTQGYDKKILGVEKLEKVKFNTMTSDGTFTIVVKDGAREYSYSNIITTHYPGLYQIDLSDKDIILNQDHFSIQIYTSNRKTYVVENSIVAFTSNVSNTPIIDSNIASLPFDKSLSGYSFKLYTKTKNISSNEEITYMIKSLSGDDYSTYLQVDGNKVSQNDVNAFLQLSPLPVGKYTLTLSYGNTKEEIPLLIGVKEYVVTYYANDGTNQKKTEIVSSGESFTLRSSFFENEGYIFTGWNTEADGSGSSYVEEQEILELTSDFTLYAQWEPITYTMKYFGNGGEGNMQDQVISYGIPSKLSKNTFVKTGYIFTKWTTNLDGTGQNFTDQQNIVNLTEEQDLVINLYAQWSPISYSIHFDANGGNGSMSDQNMIYDQEYSLQPNSYTREGYLFDGWNTKANGTGTSYYDQQSISNLVSEDGTLYTLYAQWSPNVYHIHFDSNGGTGSMDDQNVVYGETVSLEKSTYSRTGYDFTHWNTKTDGTGTSYQNQQSISNLVSEDDAVYTLYAQWTEHAVIQLNKNSLNLEVGNSSTLMGTILPTTYPNKTITWSSSNPSVISVSSSGKVTALYQGEADIIAKIINGEEATCHVTSTASHFSVKYMTHVQDYGDQPYVSDGAMSGTAHESKRLEAIRIKMTGQPYPGNIEYRTHVEDYGWMSYVKNGAMSGTAHESKRLEAIQIRLTGNIANYYDVYYRVHAQDVGWMNWAKNDEMSGTASYGRRLEGIEIVIVEKGQMPPVRTDLKTTKSFLQKQVAYSTHVETYGWQPEVSDGMLSGTAHESKRLEAIKIRLHKQPYSGNIEYQTHIQDIGWQGYRSNGDISGTSGQSKRLEAIQIRLTGAMAVHYDVYYRVHAQNVGWMNWAKNGEKSGTAHYSYRLEAIEIVLVDKGEAPPTRTDIKTNKAFLDKNS